MQRYSSVKVNVVSRLKQPLSEAQAILIDGKVYAGRSSSKILVYDTVESCWSQHHENAPVTNYAIASYKGKLVLVGGANGTTMSTRVLVWDAEKKQWDGDKISQLGDMRDAAVAVEYKNHLVVCGGRKKGFLRIMASLKSVEVYDGQSWHYAANMPYDGAFLQATVSNGYLYILYPSDKRIIYCSLDALIESALGKVPEFEKIWKTLPDNLQYLNGCLTVLGNSLLALAGVGSRGNVFAYNPANHHEWVKVNTIGPNEISPIRNPCSVIVSDTEVLVCGGDLDIMAGQERTVYTYSIKLDTLPSN